MIEALMILLSLVLSALFLYGANYYYDTRHPKARLHADTAERLGLAALTEAPRGMPFDIAEARRQRDLRIHQAFSSVREPKRAVVQRVH